MMNYAMEWGYLVWVKYIFDGDFNPEKDMIDLGDGNGTINIWWWLIFWMYKLL